MKYNYENIKLLMEKLNKIIDQEIEKPLDEQDIDLINECMEFIDELEDELER
jgi:hypothetical protein